tara:strand:- start:147 stop:308 length:162 start_codon:yes stop_codon:yes gene_type:complete
MKTKKLLKAGDLSQYWKGENGLPSFNKTFNCWNKKPNFKNQLLINKNQNNEKK